MTTLFAPVPPPPVITRTLARRRLRLVVRSDRPQPTLHAQHAAQARRPWPIGHDGTTTLRLRKPAPAPVR